MSEMIPAPKASRVTRVSRHHNGPLRGAASSVRGCGCEAVREDSLRGNGDGSFVIGIEKQFGSALGSAERHEHACEGD